jgi:hypothetical protein
MMCNNIFMRKVLIAVMGLMFTAGVTGKEIPISINIRRSCNEY